MNIVLIGSNGAGKSTIANLLYKDGFNYYKFSPLSLEFNKEIDLLVNDLFMVFDRWSVIDRCIYRDDFEMFKKVLTLKETICKHNVIIYLINEHDYDDSVDPTRIVQRPDSNSNIKLNDEYYKFYRHLQVKGFPIYLIKVSKDIGATYNQIKEIIYEQDSFKPRMLNY